MQNHSFDSFPFFIPSLLCLERVLIEKETFVFHSSNINFKNQSILFTGNSGGGKSTQADLWAKYKDAEILNGDRNILGKEENQWFTYGTPFSGSSPYCVNKKNPLDAIIILEKGPINQIRRLDIQGFNQIFSQVTVNPWDKEFCNKIMDLIIQLCNEIPIYVYSCTKDESAVNYLYETLVKDGVIHDNNE